MEIQSAFMATAAAAVLWVAIVRERRDAAGALFAALTLAFGLWSFARAAGLPIHSDVALIAIGLLAPASALQFAGHSVRLRPGLPILILSVPVILGAVLASGLVSPKNLGIAAGTWAWIAVVLGARALARSGRDAPEVNSPDATRLRYLAVAQATVALAGLLDLLAWQMGKPRSATFVAALFYLYAGYLHLARVRVKDLRQLMGNTVALTFLAGGLAGTFALLWLWVGTRLDAFAFNAFVASFVLLLFLEPAKVRIQAAMDRYFVASRLELERALGPLLERLPHIITLDELLREVLDRSEATGRLRASALYLRDDPQIGFQQAGSFGLLPRRRVHLIRAPAWVQALEQGSVLQREELEKPLDPGLPAEDAERIRNLARTIQDLDAQLVVPLLSGERLVGFWTLTDASDREPFSSTEIQFLRQIAQHMAVTIDNTKTFERVRARDRFAMLGEMSAGLAHEIRNPLATIRGSIALLDDPDPEGSAEIRKVMVEEIDRLDGLVDTFLNYAHPSTQRSVLSDLGDLVRGCVETVVRAWPGNPVDLNFECEPDLPPISANASELERVVCNVVQNAFEAVQAGGYVHVKVRTGGSDERPCVEIVVRDTGPGMDPPTLERAFIPFFTTKHTGTGLGLALSERLVRAQGGSIRLSSRPGEPTEVLIRLPVAAASTDDTDSDDDAE